MQTNSQPVGITDSPTQPETLESNQFRLDKVPTGSGLLVGDAAVFKVAGDFCATQAKCTHRGGPLSQGKLDGSILTCHGMELSSMFVRVQLCEHPRLSP